MVQSELGQWTSTLIKTSVRLGWRKDMDRLGRRGPAVIAKEFVSGPVAILVTALSIGSADAWAAGASDQVDLQFSSSEPLTLTCEKLSSNGVPLELWNNSARERRGPVR